MMGSIGAHRDSELVKLFRFDFAFRSHGDLELLKSFHSNIQDSGHVGHLENLQTFLFPNCKLD